MFSFVCLLRMNTSADKTCTKQYKNSLTGYLEGKGMEGAREEDEGRIFLLFSNLCRLNILDRNTNFFSSNKINEFCETH